MIAYIVSAFLSILPITIETIYFRQFIYSLKAIILREILAINHSFPEN